MNITVRKAEEKDIPRITDLLFQVHKVHSDKRPDLFRRGSKKYDENELFTDWAWRRDTGDLCPECYAEYKRVIGRFNRGKREKR